MTVINRIFEVSDSIKDNRSITDVFTYMITETGELAQEITIDTGYCSRDPGPDGIVGEAIDVIACAVDIIRLQCPDMTEEELELLVQQKLNKWIANAQT